MVMPMFLRWSHDCTNKNEKLVVRSFDRPDSRFRQQMVDHLIGKKKKQKTSVTRWFDYVSIFGHLQQWKIAQKCKKFAKVGLLFCQKRNKPPTSSQRLVKLCHSDEISPNLVTLRPNKNNNICANKLFCKYRLGFGNALSLLLLRHSCPGPGP